MSPSVLTPFWVSPKRVGGGCKFPGFHERMQSDMTRLLVRAAATLLAVTSMTLIGVLLTLQLSLPILGLSGQANSPICPSCQPHSTRPTHCQLDWCTLPLLALRSLYDTSTDLSLTICCPFSSHQVVPFWAHCQNGTILALCALQGKPMRSMVPPLYISDASSDTAAFMNFRPSPCRSSRC